MKQLWDNDENEAGKMFNPGDVIFASVQFTDTAEVKIRPAVDLFEESGNAELQASLAIPK
jgi:hypothetical protein